MSVAPVGAALLCIAVVMPSVYTSLLDLLQAPFSRQQRAWLALALSCSQTYGSAANAWSEARTR